jgi:hypothetical protein
MFSMTGTVGVAGSGVALIVALRWLFQVATDGPSVAIPGAGGGLFGSWLGQHVERVLTAPYLPAVLALSGIVMAAIGIVQFIRRR